MSTPVRSCIQTAIESGTLDFNGPDLSDISMCRQHYTSKPWNNAVSNGNIGGTAPLTYRVSLLAPFPER